MAVIRALLVSRLFWVLVGIWGLWSAGRILVRDLAHDPRFDAPPVASVEAPAWAGSEAVRPVQETLEALGPLNLFDPHFEDRISTALRSVPGVKSVGEIHRLWPRRYAVTFVLHRPVATVRNGIPVTGAGVVLEKEPFRTAVRGLLAISGLRGNPPPPGEPWRSRLLDEGIATLLQLGPFLEELEPLGLFEIDVSEADDPRRGVSLRGVDGITVRWGRSLARVGENPVEKKASFLRLAARYLERVRGKQIDVRYRDLYLRESSTP